MLALLAIAAPALATPGAPDHWEPVRVSEASVMMAGADGTCDVLFSVDDQGRTTAAQVRSCPLSLSDQVREVAQRWTFEPLAQGAFTYRATVPVVPPALDLPPADPGEPVEQPLPADTQPVVRKLKEPGSPMALRSFLKEHGRRFAWELCQVEVRVGPDGKVSSARPLDCAELLWPAVRRAAFKTRFDPAFKDGQPVPAITELELVVKEMP